jgi:hypothetical protein
LEGVNNEQSFIGFIGALGSDFASERILEQTMSLSPYGPGARDRKMDLWIRFLMQRLLERPPVAKAKRMAALCSNFACW